ncbi:MAG: VWA domain-containing protein [Dehalococcoidia bacterium]
MSFHWLTGLSFAWPLALFALLLIPAAAVLYWWVQKRRSKYAVRFTNIDLLANVVDRTPDFRRHVPPVLLLAALALLIFGLARPQSTEKTPKEEATVILVTDVSGSMNAEDVEPTRLAAAKESARDLVDTLPEKFQVAVVAFSTNVRTIVPPTNDRDLIYRGIDSLTAVGGTAMGDAIVQALDIGVPPLPVDDTTTPGGANPTPSATPAADGKQKPAIIVLLSDGFNSTGNVDPIDAANEALGKNVPIYTVALGTPDGYVDITQNGRTQRVRVPPDVDTLTAIAEISGGKFFNAPNAGQLEGIYKDLGSKIGFDLSKTDQTHWFAAAAAVFMLAGAGLSLAWFNRFP